MSIAHAATDDDALESLADRLLELDGRVLMLGAPGTGKSTLALRLGGALTRRGTTPGCIGADPGSPQFGAPGAVCLGRWDGGEWKLVALEALCSLDAGRFRLPLTACVRRLAPGDAAPLILDGPGVVRGVAGAELLAALIAARFVDADWSFLVRGLVFIGLGGAFLGLNLRLRARLQRENS